LQEKRNPRGGGGPETLTVINNKRQEYAYKVLESYYDFYYKKEYYNNVYNPDDRNYNIGLHMIYQDIHDDFREELTELWNRLRDSEEAIRDAMQDDVQKMLDQLFEISEQKQRDIEDYQSKMKWTDYPTFGIRFS